MSGRSGGYGRFDGWATTRSTTADEWSDPVNLGPAINTPELDGTVVFSTDSSTLLFMSGRPGGHGGFDIWQVPILPVVDFNSDGIVDAIDMCMMVDYWHTDEPLYDIAPIPFGDGVVDIKDLIVLAEHLFEKLPPVELGE